MLKVADSDIRLLCISWYELSSNTMTLIDATSLSLSDASKSETEQDICSVVSP